MRSSQSKQNLIVLPIFTHFELKVEKHKTDQKFGYQNVIATSLVHRWMTYYANTIRQPKHAETPQLFLNTVGKPMSGTAKQLSKTWKEVTGVKRSFTASINRHVAESMVSEFKNMMKKCCWVTK